MSLQMEWDLVSLRADYDKTLALLRALKSGEAHLDGVVLTPNGWTYETPVPKACEPECSEVACDMLPEQSAGDVEARLAAIRAIVSGS